MLAFISLDWLQQGVGVVMDFLPIVWLFLGWMCLRALRRIIGGKSKSVSFSVHDGISKGEWDEFKLSVFAQLSSLRDGTANQLSNFQHRLTGMERGIEKFVASYKGDSKAMEERIKETYFKSIKLFDRDFERRATDIFTLVMAMVVQTGEFKVDLDANAKLPEGSLFAVEGGSLVVQSGLSKGIKGFASVLDYKPHLQGVAGKVVHNESKIADLTWRLVLANVALVSQNRVLKQVCELSHVGPLLPDKSQLEELVKMMQPIISEVEKQTGKIGATKKDDTPDIITLSDGSRYDPCEHINDCQCRLCKRYEREQKAKLDPILQAMAKSPRVPERTDCPRCGDEPCDCDELIEDHNEKLIKKSCIKKKPLKKRWPKKASKKKAPLKEEDDGDDFGDDDDDDDDHDDFVNDDSF